MMMMMMIYHTGVMIQIVLPMERKFTAVKVFYFNIYFFTGCVNYCMLRLERGEY
jgi:uncharacterized membrane protein